MGLPRKLKNLNTYVDGEGFLGTVAEFEEPKLAIATEEWRGGGMLGPVMLDKGLRRWKPRSPWAGTWPA